MVGGKRRTLRHVLLLALAITLMPVAPASANHTASSRGVVGGFGEDGDFVYPSSPALSGETRDWATVGNVLRVNDASNSSADDAFGGGSKEQEPDGWTYDTGKPPGKADLTRIYAAKEVTDSSALLWLAFERLDVQGSGDAHVDFELNQKTSTITNAKGTVIPERTPNDLLVVYDYSGGTGPVNIEVRKWTGTALAGAWVAATLPAGSAHGDINNASITRPAAAPFGGGSVGARRFGEVGLDVRAIFGPGFVTCPGFSSIVAKTRSSGESFNSALKDRTAPQGFDFSSCGSITVLKRTDGGAPLNGSVFGLWRDNGDGVYDENVDTFVGTCTAGEEGIDGQCTFEQVPPGTYFVREILSPDGYVLDTTVAPVVVGFRDDTTVSHTFFDPKIRYRITLDPHSDSNLVDTDHVITATLEKSLDQGSSYIAASGETVSFSLSGQGSITSITPAGPDATSCTTSSEGTCTVTIHSNDAGSSSLTASFHKETATTPVDVGDSAGKTWANYRITTDPGHGTNVVDNDHVVTVTIERTTDGSTWAPVEGATPDVTLTGVGSISENGCASGTGSDGTCTVTIVSDDAGEATLAIDYLAVEGNTSRTFSASAGKTWVDFRLAVTPGEAVNPVRASDDGSLEPHTFTVTIERTENGTDYSPVVGAHPDVSLSGVGSIEANTCDDPGTGSDGTCTVRITSSSAGTSTLNVSYLGIEGSSSKEYEAEAVKRWEDIALTLTPGSAYNQVGQPHTFTVTLTHDTGGGFGPFAGEVVALSLDQGPTDAEFVSINGEQASGTSAECTTRSDGTCEVVINATTPGPVVLTAAWDGLVGTVETTRSAEASKTYLAIALTKSSCPEFTTPRGGLVQYRIDFSVAGDALTDASVVDVLPAEVGFLAASDIAGVSPTTPAVGEAGVVSWTFPTLDPGTYSATIDVQVDGDVPLGARFTNTVTLDANEIDPASASHALDVSEGGSADGRAYGVRADLLGGGLVIGDPDIEPTPDSDVTNPDTLLAVPNPLPGSTGPLVSVLNVAEFDSSSEDVASYTAIATAADVDINIPGVVRVQSSDVVARSSSSADLATAGSSSAGSKIGDLRINGTQHGDVTSPSRFEVRNPLSGDLIAEVRVLEEIPGGAAASQPQPNGNAEFASSLVVNGIHVTVYDIPGTPIDESSDVIVSHARTAASFPSGLGCNPIPSVSGRAFLVHASGTLDPDEDAAGRLGEVVLPITGGSLSKVLADVDLPIGTSDTGTTATQGSIGLDPEAADADSSATVEGLDLLGGMITATAVKATSASSLAGSTGSTTIADLVIGGTDVCATLGLQSTCTPAPNTVLLLPGAGGPVIVMLNEQLPEPGGLTVNAIHIWVLGQGNPLGLPAGAEVIISSAHSDAHPA